MSSEGIVTDHIGLAVTVDISVLGESTFMSAPSLGVVDGLFWVPGTTVSEHGPMVSARDITEHLDFLVTVKVGESSPGGLSMAPSLDVGMIDGSTEASIAIGHSVPMSSEGIRADLVSSSFSVEVSVVNVGSSVRAPSSTEFVCSGVSLGNEVVVEFFLLLDFVGSNDGCE